MESKSITLIINQRKLKILHKKILAKAIYTK